MLIVDAIKELNTSNQCTHKIFIAKIFYLLIKLKYIKQVLLKLNIILV